MKTNTLKLTTLFTATILSSSLSFAGIAEDTAITTAVKAKLLLQKDIPSTDIGVTTKDNEVFLRGTVGTSLQADKAIELAASTDDVIEVDYTELLIKDSSTPNTDSYISAKVKGRITQLANDKKITPGHDVTIETNNKEVHIHGSVADSNDISTIEDAVKKIKYVDSIKTNIQVKK